MLGDGQVSSIKFDTFLVTKRLVDFYLSWVIFFVTLCVLIVLYFPPNMGGYWFSLFSIFLALWACFSICRIIYARKPASGLITSDRVDIKPSPVYGLWFGSYLPMSHETDFYTGILVHDRDNPAKFLSLKMYQISPFSRHDYFNIFDLFLEYLSKELKYDPKYAVVLVGIDKRYSLPVFFSEDAVAARNFAEQLASVVRLPYLTNEM